MPWENDNYRYTVRTLKSILGDYSSYEYNSYSHIDVAFLDKKIDFDCALVSLSPKEQVFMKLCIEGVDDWELDRMGYWNATGLKLRCLRRMMRYLNGEGMDSRTYPNY